MDRAKLCMYRKTSLKQKRIVKTALAAGETIAAAQATRIET